MAKATAPDSPCLAPLRRWVAQHPPVPKETGHPWAVAFSGGADSTALLLAAHALWPGRVQAFHVHHGLQAAADGFEQHAREFCAQLNLPLRVVRVDARHQSGESPEDAARRQRYQALAALAAQHGAAWVLLGQHAQDQVETVLLALSRGAGLPGLAGMSAEFVREGAQFGRPMLDADGHDLRQWLQSQGVAYVEDPTNGDQRYTRNRIRARLMPALREAFPVSAKTFARSARHAAQAQALLDEVARDDLQSTGTPPRIAALQQLSRARQANVLRHWLRQVWQVGPSEAQLQEVLDQIDACRTRGHRIQIKVGEGCLQRDADRLQYRPPL